MNLPTVSHLETQIREKIGHSVHYPGPIAVLGGMRFLGDGNCDSLCRIPGVLPPQVRFRTFEPKTRSNPGHCFDYGSRTRFPAKCRLGDRYDCSTNNDDCSTGCSSGSNCRTTCDRCNHHYNVIFY